MIQLEEHDCELSGKASEKPVKPERTAEPSSSSYAHFTLVQSSKEIGIYNKSPFGEIAASHTEPVKTNPTFIETDFFRKKD